MGVRAFDGEWPTGRHSAVRDHPDMGYYGLQCRPAPRPSRGSCLPGPLRPENCDSNHRGNLDLGSISFWLPRLLIEFRRSRVAGSPASCVKSTGRAWRRITIILQQSPCSSAWYSPAFGRQGRVQILSLRPFFHNSSLTIIFLLQWNSYESNRSIAPLLRFVGRILPYYSQAPVTALEPLCYYQAPGTSEGPPHFAGATHSACFLLLLTRPAPIPIIDCQATF